MVKMNEPRDSPDEGQAASQTHGELLEAILDRSASDREFRRALLCRPKDAIFDAYGVRVPEDYRLRFIERDPQFDSVVVLPDFSDGDGCLSDDDLDVVHGGTSTTGAGSRDRNTW